MGEWSIYGVSSGQVKAAVKKLEYNGEFMGERSLTCTLYSPTPIDLEVGDYITYRNEVFSIDYDPSVLKQSRRETYGQGFVYENVKFGSRQMELVHCKFLDYVIADNQVHYSSLPTFSFYCESITNLTERIQANLNRLYTGGNAWTITVHTENVSVGRINIDVDGATCWDALAFIADKFKSTFVIRGRSIEVAPSTNVLEGMFQYGNGNGLRSIARTSDASQKIVTRLRAMGNTTNMPLNYYRNRNTLVYAPITEYLGPYDEPSLGADIHTTLQFNNCFLSRVNNQDNQYRCMVSLDKSLYIHAIFTANTGDIGFSVCTVGMYDGNTQAQVTQFLTQLASGTYTKLYFKSGVDKDKWPSAYKESTGVQVDSIGDTRLMLPSYPDETTDPYIDSANIAKYGIREESVLFDGSNDLEDIYPTIEHMTADRAREAGATIDLDAGDNGNLDEIVSATQITDDGIPPVQGEDKQMAETFTITIKDIGFNINEYLAADNATISMRDGKCEGREFEITQCVKSGNKYVLTCKRELDDSLNRYFPYYDYNLTAGDKFVLLQIEMPELYVDAAAQRLEDAAEAYLATIDHSIYTIEPKIDNIKAKRHDDEVESAGEGVKVYDTIYEGMLMQIEDEDLDIDDAIFIDRLTIKEGDSLIPQYEVVLRNEKVKSSIQQIQQQITDIKSGVAGVSGNGTVDVNQVNQLIKNYGDNRFLRKDIIDKLKQGVQVGDSFVSGLLGEGGIFRKEQDGKTYLEADSLYIRMKAYFDTLEVRKLQYSSGNRVASAAGIKAIKVEKVGMYNNNPVVLDDDGYYHYTDGQGHEQSVQLTVTAYRCYFRMKDSDNNPIDNDFVAGDLARSQEFNLQSGLRSYWRKVVRTNGQTPDEDGLGWIDLSNVSGEYLSGSGEPTAQDDIVQLGNVNDTGRQGAIIEYSTGAGNVPSYQIYQGINTFSLDGKNYIDLGYNPTTGRAYMNVRGDFRFGSSSNNGSYINYNSSTGELSVKAAITGTSTIDGGSFDAYVKAHQNNYDDTDVYNYINEVQSDLQEQIDGAIETISDHGEPTGSNDPYASLTPQQKERHIGDMYYDLDTGYAYRYVKDGNSFYWMLIEDSDVQRAIADAAAALLMAGSKGKIFTTTAGTLPTPPYNVNDVWVNATYPSNATSTNAANHVFYNDILKCVTARAEGGTPSINDWALASKYTDDATVNGLISQILNNTGGSGDSATAGSALYMLKKALVDGDYYQQGGLVLANLMAVRDGQTITAGINGHLDSNALGGGIAAWYGGLNLDKEDGATQNYAKSLFRFDGSGYLASGNIRWTDDGKVYLSNLYTGNNSPISSLFFDAFSIGIDGSESYINPNFTFSDADIVRRSGNTYTISGTSVLNRDENDARYMVAERFFDLFDVYNDGTPYTATYKTSGLPQDTSKISIKAKFGLWTDSFLSALGLNSSSGGGGASVLDDLDDVSTTGAQNGQALVYNSSTNTWVPGNVATSGVTSVGLSMPTGFSVSGSPITTSGTIAVTLASGYSLLTNSTQIIAGQKTFSANTTFSGHIYASSNGTKNIGSASQTFNGVYAQYLSFGSETLYLHYGNNNLLWGNSAIAMVSDLDGYLPLSGGTLTGSLVSQQIRPSTNSTGSNGYYLGTSSYRWRNVYSVYGNFSGLITASNSGIKIGNCTISWDSTNGMLKFDTGIYSTGAVSALGANSGGGGGGATTLEGLEDVQYTGTPANGQALIYNGSVWTNGAVSTTDTNVTQTATTTSAAYEILFSATADNQTRTEGARKTSYLTYNPSTKALSTGGAINGYTLGASSITTSTTNIPTSNAVKTFVEGKGYVTTNSTYKLTLNGTTNGTSTGTSLGSLYAPTGAGTSGYVLQSNGSGAPSWVAQSTLSVGTASKLGTSNVGSTTRPIYLNAGTPTQCGTSLAVSITGNAATATSATSADSATKLATARTLWGQSFDGTTNVKGTITSDYFKLNDSTSNPYLRFSHTYSGTDYTYYVQASNGHLYLGQSISGGKYMRINSAGNVVIDSTTRGFYLTDGAGNHYPLGYDNGANLWIGATATAATHHTGQTFISAGYDSTNSKGYSTIRICVPNSSNNNGTNYYALHSGNFSTYLDDRYVTMATAQTITGVKTFASDIYIRKENYAGVSISHASTSYPDRVLTISQRDTSNNWVANYAIFGSNGYVAIGNNEPSYKLHVYGTIYATGGVTALSDMRHKDRIVDLSNDITDFADLPLFYFKYKKGEDDYLHIGTSAQAVNEILPELVAKKDIWGLDYSVFGTTLGILSARKLVNHEDRIKALEKENEELKQRIKTLEAA